MGDQQQTSPSNKEPAKADSTSSRNYAGFWRRFAAAILDGIIIAIVLVPFSMALGVGRNNGAGDSLYSLISLAISLGYPMYFIGAKGQTPGKMALSVKVIRKEDGQVPGYMKAFLREVVGKFISTLVFGLGFFWMIWDKDKQTWHDKIAGTVVIKTK